MKTFFIPIFVALFLLSCGAKKELYNIECISIQNEGYVKLKLLNYENQQNSILNQRVNPL
jgi:hypothetical protein